MADALLHPEDRAYTVPEIYAWLDRCGMSFGRWIEQARYLAQCGVVARSRTLCASPRCPPGCSTPPSSFSANDGQYSFIAHRDDSVDGGQPITFAGDSWRDYIPIRLPWTVCVPRTSASW